MSCLFWKRIILFRRIQQPNKFVCYLKALYKRNKTPKKSSFWIGFKIQQSFSAILLLSAFPHIARSSLSPSLCRNSGGILISCAWVSVFCFVYIRYLKMLVLFVTLLGNYILNSIQVVIRCLHSKSQHISFKNRCRVP